MPLFLRPTWPDSNRDTDFVVMYREPPSDLPSREIHVGRIHWCYAGVPKETPWQWHVGFFQRTGRIGPHEGVVASFDIAKAEWKRCWDSGDPPINWPPSLARGARAVVVRN